MKIKNKKTGLQEELISKNNFILLHFLKYKKLYLGLLLIIILAVPLLKNFLLDKPLIMGEESYYHLSSAQEINGRNFYYYPLKLFSFLPEQFLVVIPLFLAVCSLLLFLSIVKETKLNEEFLFFFLLFLILTPAVIFTYTTLSAYAVFLFLTLLGFFLLIQKKKLIKLISLIPFILATFVDLLSSFLLVVLLLIWFLKKKKEKITLVALIGVIISGIIKGLIFDLNFILGPFYFQEGIADFISDLGGKSGVGFSLILLALVGFGLARKKKEFYFAYLLLPFLITAFLFSPEVIVYFSILIIFFATTAFLKIFLRKWILSSLKYFTFFLVILSIFFSTLAYLDRVSDENGPFSGDKKVLTKIRNDLPKEYLFFSTPENSYFVKYFADHKPFFELHTRNQAKKEQTNFILNSTYVSTTFPLLEENNISLIYITPEMRANYPSDQGLLFLLKNERFILVHSSQGYEVWLFKKQKE